MTTALLLLFGGAACGGDSSIRGQVGHTDPWCAAVLDSAAAMQDMTDVEEDYTREDVERTVDRILAVRENAPDDFTAAMESRADANLLVEIVRRECGSEVASTWDQTMRGSTSEPTLPSPVRTELILPDAAPFQVSGYPVRIRATGLCPSRDLAVSVDGVAEVQNVTVDDDGVLEAVITLPAQTVPGPHRLIASRSADANQYDAPCPDETATSAEFVVRDRASLDTHSDW